VKPSNVGNLASDDAGIYNRAIYAAALRCQHSDVGYAGRNGAADVVNAPGTRRSDI
jgi:hypothetical protein